MFIKSVITRCVNSFHRILLRKMHATSVSNSHWNQPKELQIPVPYGHIAAKVWGDEHFEPVLALHGWQDNAGSFDRLIPLLSSKLHIVAIDAPGHGLSSHKPCGTFYNFMEMILDVKRIVTYLKWDRFSFLSHSMGGALASMYSSIFPEAVKNLILLDIITPDSRATDLLPDLTRNGVDSMLKFEEKMLNVTPVYSMEDAKARLIAGIFDEITNDSADALLKRGCQPSSCGKGVVFSRDIRLQAKGLHKLSHDDLKSYLKRVKCNMLIIIGKQSIIERMIRSRTPELYDDFINIYKENCKSCKIVKVDGNHFVHLNNPDCVAPHIDAFFSQHLG